MCDDLHVPEFPQVDQQNEGRGGRSGCQACRVVMIIRLISINASDERCRDPVVLNLDVEVVTEQVPLVFEATQERMVDTKLKRRRALVLIHDAGCVAGGRAGASDNKLTESVSVVLRARECLAMKHGKVSTE